MEEEQGRNPFQQRVEEEAAADENFHGGDPPQHCDRVQPVEGKSLGGVAGKDLRRAEIGVEFQQAEVEIDQAEREADEVDRIGRRSWLVGVTIHVGVR